MLQLSRPIIGRTFASPMIEVKLGNKLSLKILKYIF